MLKQPWYKKSRIQDFGYLICTDLSGLIQGISANITDILPQSFNYYLGKPISSISCSIFEGCIHEINEATKAVLEIDYIRKTIDLKIRNQPYYLSIYKEGKVIYFELEEKTVSSMTYLSLSDLSTTLYGPSEHLWQKVSDNISNLLGLHKTVIFKINNSEGGTVCAETINGDFKSTKNLNYSEEFITADIIAFYEKMPSRYCYDINSLNTDFYTSYASNANHLDTHLAPFPATYVTYCKEIGAKSIVIIPIIINNKLWGLMIALHFENKWIDLHLRQVSSMILQYASNTFSSSLKHNLLKFHKMIKEFELDLKGKLLVNEEINTTVVHNIQSLCDIVNADGIAIIQHGDITRFGICPEENQLTQIVNIIKKHKDKRVFKDHNFSSRYQSAIHGKLPFAGLMSLKLNKASDYYIIWFRKETYKEIISIARSDKFVLQSTDKESIAEKQNIYIKPISDSSIFWNANDLYLVNRIFNLIQEIKIIKSEEHEKVNQELISLNNELEMLTFTLSHDLKNPLSIVKLGSQMLQVNTNLTKKDILKWSSTIQESTQSIENLVGSSLAFVQAKSYIFKKTTIQMAPILRMVINESRLMYEKKSCEIILNSPLPIHGERNLLYQMFLNLIGNAIKYSSEHDFPKIEISSFIDDQHIIYTIKDNGIGIPEADLLSIFELFKRSSNVKQFNGSGVGLALVKRILDRLDAKAEIESIENEGTLIRLYFPKENNL